MAQYKSFLKKGKESEAQFAKLFRDTIQSTKEQDIKDHWDVQINYKIDVKSVKKTNRSDNQENQHIHWVELRNVNGNLGWLYSEKTDFFSFELNDYWVIVEKHKLQDFISKKVEKIFEPNPTLYKLYRRPSRPYEITVLVSTIDLIYISECLIEKT